MPLITAELSIFTAAFDVFGEMLLFPALVLAVASVIIVDGVDLNIGFVKMPADGRFNKELSPGVIGVPFTVGCIILM